MNRTNFRRRDIDLSKQIPIIKDINEVYKKEDNSALNWVGNSYLEGKSDPKAILEAEVKRIMELFDKKKSIIIPGSEKFDKSSQSNTGEGKFTTVAAYKQTEFIRPKNYILYSEKNRIDPKVKDYEATVSDMTFLKFENNPITVDELEKIISALENDINKGEMIPPERVKEIIISIIPDKKHSVEKIYKYWNTRREDFKKSLLRKYWKDQKHSDKFLSTTFARREREKMTTRRNKKNETEGLRKLKEIQETTQNYLHAIVTSMREKENSKKALLLVQHLEFSHEISVCKGEKNTTEDKWKEFIKNNPIKPLKSWSPKKIAGDENIPPLGLKLPIKQPRIVDHSDSNATNDTKDRPLRPIRHPKKHSLEIKPDQIVPHKDTKKNQKKKKKEIS